MRAISLRRRWRKRGAVGRLLDCFSMRHRLVLAHSEASKLKSIF